MFEREENETKKFIIALIANIHVCLQQEERNKQKSQQFVSQLEALNNFIVKSVIK